MAAAARAVAGQAIAGLADPDVGPMATARQSGANRRCSLGTDLLATDVGGLGAKALGQWAPYTGAVADGDGPRRSKLRGLPPGHKSCGCGESPPLQQVRSRIPAMLANVVFQARRAEAAAIAAREATAEAPTVEAAVAVVVVAGVAAVVLGAAAGETAVAMMVLGTSAIVRAVAAVALAAVAVATVVVAVKRGAVATPAEATVVAVAFPATAATVAEPVVWVMRSMALATQAAESHRISKTARAAWVISVRMKAAMTVDWRVPG